MCIRDRFKRVVEANLPPLLLLLPEGLDAPPVTLVPRPWLPRVMPVGSVRDTVAQEVYPPPSPVEVRPPVLPEEFHPPSAPVEARPPIAHVQEATGTESPSSSCWAELIEAAEAADALKAVQQTSPTGLICTLTKHAP